MNVIEQIPEPHRRWWRAWGLDFGLRETQAQCASCNMSVSAVRDGQTRAQTYDAKLKCCTFFPEIPNFLWADVSARFQVPLEGVLTPSGLAPSLSYHQRFQQNEFGSRADLLCPFFSRGACGIWQTRPSPCVSFVCQSSYGIAGQKFWQAAEALLKLTEVTLAHDVLLRLGFTPAEIETGRWFEFKADDVFARASHIVAALGADEVWDLIQPQGSELRDQLCQAAADALAS